VFIALLVGAGIAALALSVRGWHRPEMAVLGAGLFLRAGYDLGRRRPTNNPPPRRPAPTPRPAPNGWSEGAARVAAWERDWRDNYKGGNP